MPRFIGGDCHHRQLPRLDRFRLSEPRKIHFLDEFRERLGFEHGAAQSLTGSSYEHLIKGLYRQPMNLFTFCLAFHLAGLLSVGGVPLHSSSLPAIWLNCSWAAVVQNSGFWMIDRLGDYLLVCNY